MRVRHLKTFVVAAESGNFAQAADRLNMTPSAVSLQMKTLEEALSTALFDRTVRPAQLTPQVPSALLERAAQIGRNRREKGIALQTDDGPRRAELRRQRDQTVALLVAAAVGVAEARG